MGVEDIERELLTTHLDVFSARIAQGLRDGVDDADVFVGEDTLTAVGRAWVEGYLVAQLSLVRSCRHHNCNVSHEDLEAIRALVCDTEQNIAAELYA
ncbi:MAG: hypothetical protein ABEI77_04400 [Halorientalis sp.]